MKRVLPSVFGIVIGTMLLVGNASAKAQTNNGHENDGTVTAPEFDPATAGAVAAILVGGGLLVARKRKG